MNIKGVFNNFKFLLFLLISTATALGMLSLSKNFRIKIFIIAVYLIIAFFLFAKRNTINISNIFFKSKKANIMTLIIESIIYMDVYYNYSDCIPTVLKKISLFSEKFTLAIFVFLGCILAYFSVYYFSKWFIHLMRPFFLIVLSRKKLLLLIFAVYLVALIPLIRANYYYIDDLARTVYGYDLTGDFSRYLATLLSYFVHGNTWLTDVSPLPQISACFILAVIAVFVLHIFEIHNFKCENYVFAVASVVPLGLFPYFLNCLSYKYDAPYMALSVLSAIFPVLYYKTTSLYKYGIAVFVGTIIVCTTYQASTGIYPMLVVLLVLIMWIKKDDIMIIGKFVLSSLIGYLSGMVVFRMLLMAPLDDSYIEGEFSLNYIIENIKLYYSLVFNDFPVMWLLIVAILIFIFCLLVLFESKQNKLLTGIITAISVFVMAIISFGAYIIFATPSTSPRAMYGFGVFITFLCVVIISSKRIYLGKALTLVLSWFIFVFSFTFGNALDVQNKYDNFRITQLVSDLKDTDILKNNDEVCIQIIGTVGYSKSVSNMIEEYNILERIVPITLCDSSWHWGSYKLNHYYNLDVYCDNKKDLTKFELPIIKNTVYHTIKGRDNYILIELK